MSGPAFVAAARQRLAFLSRLGWRVVFEHVDQTAVRSSDFLVLRRDPILMRLERPSPDDALHVSVGWIDLDLPVDQQVHPVSSCTLNDLLDAAGAFALSLETMRAVDALDELARTLRTTLAGLAQGDDALIAEASERRALADARARQLQRERSVYCEIVNGVEILEVPATPADLGQDSFRRFPENEPDRGTWFIVATPLGDMVVYSLAAARAMALEFGAHVKN